MKYLLDTHAALWWWANDARLSDPAQQVMRDGSAELYFSAISGYEIFLKNRLGKLPLPTMLLNDFETAVADEGWRVLGINLDSSLKAARYDDAHRDPFDRILAAQCETHGLTLISKDSAFGSFPITVLW